MVDAGILVHAAFLCISEREKKKKSWILRWAKNIHAIYLASTGGAKGEGTSVECIIPDCEKCQYFES